MGKDGWMKRGTVEAGSMGSDERRAREEGRKGRQNGQGGGLR